MASLAWKGRKPTSYSLATCHASLSPRTRSCCSRTPRSAVLRPVASAELTPTVQRIQCPEGEAPVDPPQLALKDTISPCTPSGAGGGGAPGTNLLGDGGVVVLQDEPLDMVSPVSFLLHCFGLGGPKGEGKGVTTCLEPCGMSLASAERGGGAKRAPAGASVQLPRLRGAHSDPRLQRETLRLSS